MTESPAIQPGHPQYPSRTKEQIAGLKNDLRLALQAGLSANQWAKARGINPRAAYRWRTQIYEEFHDEWAKHQKEAVGRFIAGHERVITNAQRKAEKSVAWAQTAVRASEGLFDRLQSIGVLPKVKEGPVVAIQQNSFTVEFEKKWEELNDYGKRVASKIKPPPA